MIDMGPASGLKYPKAEPRKRTKARKDRAEATVKKSVRLECVARDGACRLCFHSKSAWAFHFSGDVTGELETENYGGVSEWAHMHTKRRSQTRGQAPDVRHTTADSLMLCKFHHDQYDGRATPRLRITKLTRRGADGPLKFTRAKA